MKLESKYYPLLVGEALEYDDVDAYVNDLALSDIWNDLEGEETIPTERIDFLRNLWEAMHMNVKEIAATAHLSQRKLAERFAIPYHTVENWCMGISRPPEYVRLMMLECLGIYKIPFND